MTPEKLAQLLPLAIAWAQAQRDRILAEGVPLESARMEDAQMIGVKEPHKVRLLSVSRMPRPEDPVLMKAVDEVGFLGPEVSGLTLGHGIFIRHDQWGNRPLIVHELIHTCQYERMGFEGFLKQYLLECVTLGYNSSPMELEARHGAWEHIGNHPAS
jgi:hypothetical protein